MNSRHEKYMPQRWVIQVAVLLLALLLSVPVALAVEPGKLSITAEGVTAARAIFHMHPDEKVRNDDYMAKDMIHPDYWHYSIMVDDLEASLKLFKTFRMTTSFFVNARTKHIDSILKNVAKDGVAQVVNLGAGYDSRAYRFHSAMPKVKFFEIELPEMVVEKKKRLKRVLGKVPDHVAFVPIDFNTQTIPDELKKAGYDPTLKTLFIWEGVTMYISAEAVDGTLKFIRSQSAPGSSVVFDYMPLAVIKGNFDKYKDVRGLAFWVRYRGEPFVFGIAEGQCPSYVEQRGLKVMSDIGPKEMEALYLTLSNGKLVGPCNTGFRIMHAAVPAKQ
jgi:methyltransferase (TIGR00027 family)